VIGQIVNHMVRMRRVHECEHEWKDIGGGEEQCTRCTIIATPEGKVNLARITARYRAWMAGGGVPPGHEEG